MNRNTPDGYKVSEESESQIVRKKGNTPKELAFLAQRFAGMTLIEVPLSGARSSYRFGGIQTTMELGFEPTFYSF